MSWKSGPCRLWQDYVASIRRFGVLKPFVWDIESNYVEMNNI